MGDVHGDLTALVRALALAKLIAPLTTTTSLGEIRWIGEDSLLVQVGDVLDRGSEECSCFFLLALLSRQAKEVGGGVVLLLGNHEILNVLGLFNYAEKGGNEEFEKVFGEAINKMEGTEKWRINYAGNQPARWRAMEPGGMLSFTYPFLSNFVLSVQVGSSVFVHGGITPNHLKTHGTLTEMNNAARSWLSTSAIDPFPTPPTTKDEIIARAQSRANTIEKTMPSFLGGGTQKEPSPIWSRVYSSPNDRPPSNTKFADSQASEALAKIGNEAKRFVVGHTPQDNINSALDGKVWRIDVAMSKGMGGGNIQVLEIIEGGRGGGEDRITILGKEEINSNE